MSGTDQMRRRWSARQRVVVLTFNDVKEAEAWDAAGQPIGDDLVEFFFERDVITGAGDDE